MSFTRKASIVSVAFLALGVLKFLFGNGVLS